MRDTLPKSGPHINESAIVNLDSINNRGTHWVAFKKTGDQVTYFDSYGNLPPPLEVTRYLRRGSEKASEIYYTYKRYQKNGSVNCGHLCLKFLLGEI